MKERPREAGLPRRPPSVFQFSNPGGVLRPITPIPTCLFWMRKIRTWRPAVCSGTEELTHSPLTNRMHGADSSIGTTFSENTQICILALHRVLMLEFLAYHRLILPLIIHPLISTPKPMKKLWRKNSKKEDTLAPSRGLNSSLSSGLSNLHPSPLFPNLENQGNFAQCTTSLTHTHHVQIWYLQSTQPSTHTISPAPGELSLRYASSSIVYRQDRKLPSEMCLKPIVPSLSITINGQVWSCNSEVTTNSQQTPVTISDSPRQEGPMASSQTQAQTSSKQMESALYPNGWMTIFSSRFLAVTSKCTTTNAMSGLNWSR